MPQIKSIPITDGTTLRTLTPDANTGDGFRFSSTDAAIQSGNIRGLMSVKTVKNGKSHYIRLAFPLIRTGDTTLESYVPAEIVATMDFKSSKMATPEEIQEAVSYFKDFLADTDVTAALEQGKSWY